MHCTLELVLEEFVKSVKTSKKNYVILSNNGGLTKVDVALQASGWLRVGAHFNSTEIFCVHKEASCDIQFKHEHKIFPNVICD